MADINAYFLDLPGSYLFAEVARRVNAHLATKPAQRLIRMGIGDVTRPLTPSVLAALESAVIEQSTAEGFKGYGPEQGYAFLREAIAETEYPGLGVNADEIFVSSGSKCDLGNFQELFAPGCRVAITDPVYPAYADANVMAGRAGTYADGRFGRLIYLPCTAENAFVPELPAEKADIIYLCLPNNPTGTVLTKEQLRVWVEYARKNDSVIFFDAAYQAYIREQGIPKSIYEVEGAHEVAVEFRSYSKTAGFTGLRCGVVVVPKTVTGKAPGKKRVPLFDLWFRRQSTKYNGCPYIVQRAAAATHTPQGRAECKRLTDAYLANARMIREAFAGLGLAVAGGINGPYVWVKLPGKMDSWEFFNRLLQEADIVGTPGDGFGPSGKGYFRFTGFGSEKDTREAIARLQRFSL